MGGRSFFVTGSFQFDRSATPGAADVFEPVDDALERVRRDDVSGLETLMRLLGADVYCFRSGYVKADVLRFLTRAEFDEDVAERLRQVVLAVVDGPDRREFRSYIRLARRLDSPALREQLGFWLGLDSSPTARHAAWVLDGLERG